MPRKKSPGYFVNGQFVAKGSELDLEFAREREERAPSKTELKAHSTELQTMGVQLCNLPADRLSQLALPTRLDDALVELARIKDFEAQRRQRQFVGKLMRKLADEQIEAIRNLLEREREGSVLGAQHLHRVETWRERLLANDAAMTEWAREFPTTDLPRLRALVRQARKDAARPATVEAPAPQPGQATRHGRSFRELFQVLRQTLDQPD